MNIARITSSQAKACDYLLSGRILTCPQSSPLWWGATAGRAVRLADFGRPGGPSLPGVVMVSGCAPVVLAAPFLGASDEQLL